MERIARICRPDEGDRFVIVYGNGITDVFISPDYCEFDIELALVKHLKSEGFRRIIFFSPGEARGIYFRDAESHCLVRNRAQSSRSNSRTGSKVASRQFQGGFGDLWLHKAPTLPITDEGAQDDFAIVRLLDHWMRDENAPRTAIIIQQAETTLRFFGERRLLASKVGAWEFLPSRNRNRCIWLFSAESREHIGEELRIQGVLACLDKYTERAICVSPPGQTELERLLDYARLFDRITVEWAERKRILHVFHAEGLLARVWLERLRLAAVAQPSINMVDVQRRAWVCAMPADSRSAYERLMGLCGLETVKQSINEQIAIQQHERERQKQTGSASLQTSLNLMFIGNPGTGKSTIARLFSEIYHDIKILDRGHTTVLGNHAELIRNSVRETQSGVNKKINESIGGVLLIDAANQLSDSNNIWLSRDIIDALNARMEKDRGKFSVILAGTAQEMEQIINANEALKSHFPRENRILFPDYQPNELMQILRQQLRERHLPYEEVEGALISIVEGIYAHRSEQFGNAHTMRELVDSLRHRHAVRVRNHALPFNTPLCLEDIPEEYYEMQHHASPTVDLLLKKLDSFDGMASVKEWIRGQVALYELQRAIPSSASTNDGHHMLFLGNPGTGKTSVAQLMGEIFRALNMLRKGHTVETKREDFIGRYVGDSENNAKKIIEQALDGVLFIDEAYSLSRGGERDFGQLVIDVLTAAMEKYRERLIVIAAGYPQEMEEFVRSNPGLRSRFPNIVHFPDYTSQELIQILERFAHKDGFLLTDSAKKAAALWLEQKRTEASSDFGNARTVRTLYSKMKTRFARRCDLTADLTLVFEVCDILDPFP